MLRSFSNNDITLQPYICEDDEHRNLFRFISRTIFYYLDLPTYIHQTNKNTIHDFTLFLIFSQYMINLLKDNGKHISIQNSEWKYINYTVRQKEITFLIKNNILFTHKSIVFVVTDTRFSYLYSSYTSRKITFKPSKNVESLIDNMNYNNQM